MGRTGRWLQTCSEDHGRNIFNLFYDVTIQIDKAEKSIRSLRVSYYCMVFNLELPDVTDINISCMLLKFVKTFRWEYARGKLNDFKETNWKVRIIANIYTSIQINYKTLKIFNYDYYIEIRMI